MQRYDIQMNPLPKALACAETMGIQGEGITSVTILDASTVKIVTKRGVATGAAEKILPPELRRMLGAAFKLATKTLGKRFRRRVPSDIGEDSTYDPDSSISDMYKPSQEEADENSKEEGIEHVFDGTPGPVPVEDIITRDSFPDDYPSKHPKEVSIRETTATLRKLEARFCPKLKTAGPVGKVQTAVLQLVAKLPVGHKEHLTDLVGLRPELRGVHFKDVMSAANALKKKGLVEFDGFSEIWRKASFTKRQAGLEVGKTIENEHIRVHRYRPSIVVWDLTNAGKRGKKCDKFTLNDLDYIQDPKIESNVEKFEQGLPKLNYQQALKWAEIIIQDAKNRKSSKPELFKSSERGVDVAPGGFKPITINNGHLSLEVGHDSFFIKNLDDMYNEPTCIPRSKGGKKSIPQLYRWVKDNQSKVRTMNFPDLLAALSKEGIQFHQYCAID
jgi:hypothetical protein